MLLLLLLLLLLPRQQQEVATHLRPTIIHQRLLLDGALLPGDQRLQALQAVAGGPGVDFRAFGRQVKHPHADMGLQPGQLIDQAFLEEQVAQRPLVEFRKESQLPGRTVASDHFTTTDETFE